MKKKLKTPILFEDLKGRFVSVLIDNFKPNSKVKESYVGIIMGNKDGFLCLNTNTTDTFKIDKVYIRHDQILSIWEYAKRP